jgi:phage-related protein
VITVEVRDIAKVLGGIAVGKLEDRYIPYSYNFAGVDLVRAGLGAAQIVAAAYFEGKVTGVAKDILDLVGVAGAQLLVDQVAKMALGAAPTAAPAAVPVAVGAPSPAVSFY